MSDSSSDGAVRQPPLPRMTSAERRVAFEHGQKRREENKRAQKHAEEAKAQQSATEPPK